MNIGSIAKTVVAAIMAAGYAFQAYITDDKITTTEWIGIVLAVLTVLGVYAVPNSPPSPPRPPA